MPYRFYIGDGRIEDAGSSYNEPELRIGVPVLRFEDAPRSAGDAVGANFIGVGYTYWADFCDAVGLKGLFLGLDDDDAYDPQKDIRLIDRHPGASRIHPEHLAMVREALARYREHAAPDDGYTFNLVWLEWWMNWALENASTPCIVNR